MVIESEEVLQSGQENPPDVSGEEAREGQEYSPDEVVKVFREFDAKCADLAYKLSSSREYEEEAIIPGTGEREWERSQWAGLLGEAQALEPTDPVLSLLKDNFIEFLSARLSGVDTAYSHPARFMRGQTHFVDRACPARIHARQASGSACSRNAFRQIDKVWEGTKSLMADAPPDKRQEVAVACRVMGRVASRLAVQVPKHFDGLADSEMTDLQAMPGGFPPNPWMGSRGGQGTAWGESGIFPAP